MKKFFLLLSLTFGWFSLSQTQKVKLTTKQDGDNILMYAENTAQISQEVQLTLNGKGFELNVDPVSYTLIKAGEKKLIATITVTDRSTFSIQNSYNARAVKYEMIDYHTNLDELDRSGIIVFDKEGCSRCDFLTAYLIENDIPFQLVSTSVSTENNRLMWTELRNTGQVLDRVTLPVVLYQEQLFFNIQDLSSFVEDLD